MDISLVIKNRLDELGLEQRDLAFAAEVTESYISQLLTRKKAPPAPNKTDIYNKMSRFLKLPNNALEKLAVQQRREEIEKRLIEPPAPLYGEVRELVIRKCKNRDK
jgi:transcriptional regulator with XRE-family HTH domain